jgi:hypothetical protein
MTPKPYIDFKRKKLKKKDALFGGWYPKVHPIPTIKEISWKTVGVIKTERSKKIGKLEV